MGIPVFKGDWSTYNSAENFKWLHNASKSVTILKTPLMKER